MGFSVVGHFALNCNRGAHKHKATRQDPFLSGELPVHSSGTVNWGLVSKQYAVSRGLVAGDLDALRW